jgi:hypothetical protein
LHTLTVYGVQIRRSRDYSDPLSGTYKPDLTSQAHNPDLPGRSNRPEHIMTCWGQADPSFNHRYYHMNIRLSPSANGLLQPDPLHIWLYKHNFIHIPFLRLLELMTCQSHYLQAIFRLCQKPDPSLWYCSRKFLLCRPFPHLY